MVKKGLKKELGPLRKPKTQRVMYSSEELERFYFEYQTEWMPRGMSIQAYCSRNDVPYKVLNGYIRQLSKKVVEVQIDGKPEEDQSERMASSVVPPGSPGVCLRQGAGRAKRKTGAGCISVVIRFGDGTEVSRRGLDYVGLRMLVEKLEVLC